MAQQKEKEIVEDVEMTARHPVILAAMGSVFLAWYQYYIRGNKEHGLFIGLWPPTMLAFSNAIRLNDISRKLESRTANLLDRLTQSR